MSRLSFILLAPLVFAGCGISPKNSNLQQNDGVSRNSGFIVTRDGYVQVDYEMRGSQAVVGGDMLFSKGHIMAEIDESQIGLARENAQTRLWPNARIPYELPSDFEFSAELNFAISEWKKAGVAWVPRVAQDRDYVRFEQDVAAQYCGTSSVGRVGGIQKISLPNASFANQVGCKMRHVMLHEMAHALGFMHEHQRSDRDSYVKFQGSIEGNFWLSKIAGSTAETQFDINSVTMYGSENTIPRMVAKDGSIIPLRGYLSVNDIAGTKALYAPASSVNTLNTAIARCLIKSGAGKVLSDKIVVRSKCLTTCASFSTTNPNRSCVWMSERLK